MIFKELVHWCLVLLKQLWQFPVISETFPHNTGGRNKGRWLLPVTFVLIWQDAWPELLKGEKGCLSSWFQRDFRLSWQRRQVEWLWWWSVRWQLVHMEANRKRRNQSSLLVGKTSNDLMQSSQEQASIELSIRNTSLWGCFWFKP